MKQTMFRYLLCIVILFSAAALQGKSFSPYEAEEIVKNNNIALLKRKVSQGYEINNKISDGIESFFCYAVSHAEKPGIILWLIDHGADINGKYCYNNNSPLSMTLVHNQNFSAKILLEYGADVHSKSGPYESTPLHHAVFHNNQEIAEILLKHGANIHARDINGNEPICHFYSLRKMNEPLLKLLLRYGADINTRNHNGNTLLHYAANKSSEEAVTIFLKYGADVNGKNKHGQTPLHLAANWLSNTELVKILLEHKAETNVKNNNGDTPLHITFKKGHLRMSELLINHGTDLDLVNDKGEKPFDVSFADNYKIRELSADAFFDAFFRKNKKYAQYYMNSLARSQQARRDHENRRKQAARMKKGAMFFTGIAVPAAYLGYSIYEREFVFKNDPKQNRFGTFNGMAGPIIACGILSGGITTVFTKSNEKGLAGAYSNMERGFKGFTIGAIIGGTLGGVLAHRYNSQFKEKRFLYYGSSVAVVFPIFVLSFQF